nr:glucokinase [uncultured Desulfobulbus sp.]
MLLAGDIGATKTVLALYEAWPGLPIRQQRFLNVEYDSFLPLVAEFLSPCDLRPEYGCLGVAGPVVSQTVQLTNLNWTLDAEELCRLLGMKQLHLINDLVATGFGALQLPTADLLLIQPGKAAPKEVQAVLAPGSGLGEGFLLPWQDAFLPCASEGGHASFAPRNELQAELLAFMRQEHEHVSVEQVCSGLALPDLFAFMDTRLPSPRWLAEMLTQAQDKTPIIIAAALESMDGGRPCQVAEETLQLFFDILADEAANLVLKTLAFGGLFLGGGLAARLHGAMDVDRFCRIFARGTYQKRLAQVPIRLILNPETALIGAAAYGAQAVSA